MKKLAGKVAIVTGASRGIGAAIAKKLAEDGASVAVCARNLAACEETAQAVRDAGVEALAMSVDVSDAAQVDACVKAVLEKFGRVDIMVNNAGITKDGLLMRMTDADWDSVIDTNLKGTFLFSRAVARPMMKNKAPDGTLQGGSIINITSVVGITGNAGQANYSASKAGVIALTKSTAKEYGARNIQVNAVAPGFIETEMTAKLPQSVRDNFMLVIPAKRPGKPEDVANVVAFLCSSDADYVTGQVLNIDGGMLM